MRVNATMSEEDLAIIDKAASLAGENRSQFLRKAALARISPLPCARCQRIDALFKEIQNSMQRQKDEGVDELLEIAKARLYTDSFSFKDIQELLKAAYDSGRRDELKALGEPGRGSVQ